MYQISFSLVAFVVASIVVGISTILVTLVQAPLYTLFGIEPVSATTTWSDVWFALGRALPGLLVVLIYVRLRHKGLVQSLEAMAVAVGSVTGIAAMLLYLFRPHMYPDVFNSGFALLLLESSDVRIQFLIFGLMMFVQGAVAGAVYFYCSAMPVDRT